ncbi:hypothetical protein DEM27_05515 [Metarhizobium album]|uniref:Uncharacterized protein n=1 Tax=Metarhizobium album TaxID=2182425 RepID=A0A2U2DUX3_9HYPH|nr:hypothetical protein [Rhizobium album]PWE57100.1 hypothetical protein DEM27_05515 [Rhizobium album]
MRRMWPEEFNAIFEQAEEVMVTPQSIAAAGEQEQHPEPHMPRKALKLRLPMALYERVWPLAEMRFRLAEGPFAGQAVTMITTNPHYHAWHPADGGKDEHISDAGHAYNTEHVVVHFLLDDVREKLPA